MKIKLLLLLLSLIVCLAACSAVQVSQSYDNSFDFNPLNTYKIVKESPQLPNGASMPSATFNLIQSALDLEMAKKGFGKNSELADFGITWHTALNNEVYEKVNALGDWQNSFSENEEGMLMIDIVYLESGNVVWRGWMKNVLSSENLEEEINDAVEEILESFPPKSVPLGN